MSATQYRHMLAALDSVQLEFEVRFNLENNYDLSRNEISKKMFKIIKTTFFSYLRLSVRKKKPDRFDNKLKKRQRKLLTASNDRTTRKLDVTNSICAAIC